MVFRPNQKMIFRLGQKMVFRPNQKMIFRPNQNMIFRPNQKIIFRPIRACLDIFWWSTCARRSPATLYCFYCWWIPLPPHKNNPNVTPPPTIEKNKNPNENNETYINTLLPPCSSPTFLAPWEWKTIYSTHKMHTRLKSNKKHTQNAHKTEKQ